MLDNKSKSRKRVQNQAVKPKTETGEYGIDQILAPNLSDIAEIEEHSSYHFSANELEHKSDRIDEKLDDDEKSESH